MEMIFNKEKSVAWFGIVFLNLLSWLPLITMGQTNEFNYATGNVSGKHYVGGLAGGISGKGTVLRNSFARGSVTGESRVGGLAGSNEGAVVNTYSTGRVSGSSQAGGLVGSSAGSVSSSWWDNQTSGQSSSAGGMSAATDPMTWPYSSSVYTGWDFPTIWKADTDPKQNEGYPLLQPAAVYQVTIQVYPPGTGTATGAGFVKTNGQVQLDAAPSTNYVFKGWFKNGIVISTGTRYNLSVLENIALVARFESKTTGTRAISDLKTSGMIIFPNPVTDFLKIDFLAARAEMFSVEIVNINGQRVKNFRVESASRLLSFPVSDLPPGIYMVVARHHTGYETGKFVKY